MARLPIRTTQSSQQKDWNVNRSWTRNLFTRYTSWVAALFSIAMISAVARAQANPQCVKACEVGNCTSGDMSPARLQQCRAACVAKCTPPPSPAPPPGIQSRCEQHAVIAIQTTNIHYLTAVDGGGIGEPRNLLPIHTDSTVIGPWETFRLHDLAGGNVAISTSNGKFLTAVNGGGIGGSANRLPVQTDATRVGPWEQFTMVPVGAGCAFRTSDGHYLTAVNGGGIGDSTNQQPIRTDATKIGPQQTFNFTSQPNPMRGFADIHNHQFANLAFGGHAVVGLPYGPADSAFSLPVDRAYHGIRHAGDIVGGGIATHVVYPLQYGNDGPPGFQDWPNFWEVTHQKVYQDWLYRAVQGGLRLMVMMAVDSPLLCKTVHNDGRNCDDEMATIDLQINGAYAMQNYIDQQSGGPGKGWYRVVTTPADARKVIQQGKLAVVLGIETAHLFNCRLGAPCSWQSALGSYWQKGIRHFFPIHQDNNAFGGTAYFQPVVQRDLQTPDADPLHLFAQPYGISTVSCPQYYAFSLVSTGRCNELGLTADGRNLIQTLMHFGALVDTDHMSDRTFADALQIAEKFGYPVVASHAGFNEINRKEQNHEGQLNAFELQRIYKLGGMVGVIAGQGDLDQVTTYQRPAGIVQHVCGRTTETFAQAYLYALDHAPGMSIAIGTDLNGGLEEPGPRFGPLECYKFLCSGDKQEPCAPGQTSNRDWNAIQYPQQLQYPFLARASSTKLNQYSFGPRVFDFNTDGLAHVGLLPDFFADLETIQVSAGDLEPLYTSAEGYVRMWEKAQKVSTSVPLPPPIVLPPAPARVCLRGEKCCEPAANGKCNLCVPETKSCR